MLCMHACISHLLCCLADPSRALVSAACCPADAAVLGLENGRLTPGLPCAGDIGPPLKHCKDPPRLAATRTLAQLSDRLCCGNVLNVATGSAALFASALKPRCRAAPQQPGATLRGGRPHGGGHLRTMRLRTLSDAPPRTTTVATADELRAAAARGDSHIALLDHLDLRTGGVPGAAEGALDATHPALLTIRVRVATSLQVRARPVRSSPDSPSCKEELTPALWSAVIQVDGLTRQTSLNLRTPRHTGIDRHSSSWRPHCHIDMVM